MAKHTQPSVSKMPFISLFILSLIFLLAIDALHLQLGRISYSDLIAPLVDHNDTRLRKSYTGLAPVDEFLTAVLTVFMPIFTGEKPELSLFSANFAGQVPAHAVMMMVEGMRRGKAWGLTFATIWMLAMQVVGYGATMPLFYILDLLFSSHEPADLAIQSAWKLRSNAIILAVALGYVLPSGLQLLPVSKDLHQIFLAVWQPFPIYVAVFFWFFSQTNQPFASSAPKRETTRDVQGVRRIYTLATTVGALTHWCTILLVAFRSSIFSPATAERLSLYNVFDPHPVHWYGPSTIAQASMQFIQWDLYCGGLAGLVWAATLAHRAGVWDLGLKGVGEVARDALIMGMPSAVLRLLLKRDMGVKR